MDCVVITKTSWYCGCDDGCCDDYGISVYIYDEASDRVLLDEEDHYGDTADIEKVLIKLGHKVIVKEETDEN